MSSAKKPILFYSSYSFTGWNGPSILSHLSVLETLRSDIHWLTNLTKVRTSLEKLNSVSNLKIADAICLAPKCFSEIRSNDDWFKVYNRLDVRPLKNFSKFFVMGGLLSSGSNLTRHSKRIGVFPHDTGQLKFKSTSLHLLNFLLLLKAHHEYGIPIHNWVFDPLEFSFDLFHSDVAPQQNYHLYHGYDVSAYRMKRLDTLQYHYRNPTKHTRKVKDVDFVFGYTMLKGSNREKFAADIKRLRKQFQRTKLFVRDDAKQVDTLVRKAVYLSWLSRSKYTLVLPAYDSACVSIFRLIEALHADCFPLLHEDVRTEDVEKSFKVDLSPLKTLPKTEKSRREILVEMKEAFLPFRKSLAG